MSRVLVRAYPTPSMVFLAFDWPGGPHHEDFLGFAIRRSPGHGADGRPDFLFNKITFHRLRAGEKPHPSNEAPFQKFHWWDGGIDTKDRGKTFAYRVVPVRGTGENALWLVEEDSADVEVRIPETEEQGVGTWFNRAVVSSQGFDRYAEEVNHDLDKEMKWLANGMEEAIPRFVHDAKEVVGAIYHLTDNAWVVPALKDMGGDLSMVYHLRDRPGGKGNDTTNMPAVRALESRKRHFHARTKTAIMHNKFLVKEPGTETAAVLMGSANFTPEAFTVQANLLHTFRSKRMADLFAERHRLLEADPSKAATARKARWESIDDVPGMRMRLFFSPEPPGARQSIDAVVRSVRDARKSVVFSMFSPTDAELLEALLGAGDRGKMMYGLLNSIQDPSRRKRDRALEPEKAALEAQERYRIQTEIYHRSRTNREVVAFSYFHSGRAPSGFLPEVSTIDTSSRSLNPPSQNMPPTVHIHHKFIVIDGETADPTIYTGSANMSDNSLHNNDENLLQIRGSVPLSQIYLAEFFRLYEHYRARALWNTEEVEGGSPDEGTAGGFTLKTKRDLWVREAYVEGSLDYISRTQLVNPR